MCIVFIICKITENIAVLQKKVQTLICIYFNGVWVDIKKN